MSRILFLFLVFGIGCSQSQKDQYSLVKGYVVKTDWVFAIRGYRKLRAFYEYSYNDSIYTNFIVMGKNDPYYKHGDSLLIKIRQGDVHNPEIIECFYHPPKSKKVVVSSGLSDKEATGQEIQIVTIDKSKTSLSYGFSYYIVDIKPLFVGALHPEMNDSLINEYVRKKCKLDGLEYRKGIAVTISIDSGGSVSDVKFFNNENDKYNSYLRELFLKMPQWKPGVKDGNKVAVAFNVILE
jgi:hypothetical protein